MANFLKILVLILTIASGPLAFAARGSGEIKDVKSGGGNFGISNAPSVGGECKENFFACADTKTTLPACKILEEKSLSPEAYKLGECFKAIQSKLGKGDLQSRKTAALNLESVRERSFLGFVATCQGEAGKDAKAVDMMAIMKVIDNRTEICRKQMPENKDGFSPMEIALQEKQFSMYNADLYKKNPVFDKGPDDEHAKRCISAFADYAKTTKEDWKPVEKNDKIAFYYAPKADGMPPTWANKSADVTEQMGIPADKVTDKSGRKPASGGVDKVTPDHHRFEAKDWDCKPYAAKMKMAGK